MKFGKKFKLIFLPCYVAITLLFILLAVFNDSTALNFFAVIFAIGCVPLTLVLIFSSLTMGKAGDYYNYFKITNKEQKKQLIDYLSSDAVLDSDSYKDLFYKDYYSKISFVGSAKGAPDGTRKYKIRLKDGNNYYFTFIKATPENTTHQSAGWVVDRIEFEKYMVNNKENK